MSVGVVGRGGGAVERHGNVIHEAAVMFQMYEQQFSVE